MKFIKACLITFFTITFSIPAFAAPVFFGLTLFEDTPGNTSYSGVFTVDSADINALPATGLSFTSQVTSISIDIAGNLFDTTPASVVAAANDGVITGILNTSSASSFSASASPGLSLHLRSSNGFPFDWVVSDASGVLRSGSGSNSYSITPVSSVPLPPALWLFGTGLLTLLGIRAPLLIHKLAS